MKTKNLLYALLALTILSAFTACKSKETIVGCWEYAGQDITVKAENQEATDKAVEKIKELLHELESTQSKTMCFKEDGTVETTLGNEAETGTYTYDNGMLRITNEGVVVTKTEMKVVIDGNTFTVKEEAKEKVEIFLLLIDTGDVGKITEAYLTQQYKRRK